MGHNSCDEREKPHEQRERCPIQFAHRDIEFVWRILM